MNSFFKSMLALSVLSVIEVSTVNASTAYRVVDKGAVDSLEYTFAKQKNTRGESAISGTRIYDFPVQYQHLDQEDFYNIFQLAYNTNANVQGLGPLDDYNGLINGNPTANDLSWTIIYLQSLANDYEYQKVGGVYPLVNTGIDSEILTVFDEKFEDSNDYTRSTTAYINGITEDGWVYGNASAPFLPVEFTKSSGENTVFWEREFTTRGFFSPDLGETIISVMPPESRYGGESAILDISDTKIAVGYASTSIDENALDFIEDTCNDDDVLDDMPLQVCIQSVSSGMYNTEAFKWYIDSEGTVNSESLGHLVTPHEDDTRELVSVAQAVNSHGVVAGYSTGWFNGDQINPSRNEPSSIYAVVFKNDRVIDLTEDHYKYYNSRAYDINDDGIVVGYVTTQINGSARTKFYYVDTNSEDLQMMIPKGFFDTSSSVARAINEEGFIVGEGEYETHNDSSANQRRKHAFIYDINVDYFTDLNDLIVCESEYTIVEAWDINDNNEISGTAVLKTEKRDSKGELKLDEDGQQIYTDVLRAVELIPYDAEVEACTETKKKVKREGASFSVWGLLIFGVLGLVCRKKHG